MNCKVRFFIIFYKKKRAGVGGKGRKDQDQIFFDKVIMKPEFHQKDKVKA